MDDKKLKDRKKTLPAANSFSNPDSSGWIFILFNEGIMRKKWRKRYCVLSNAVLYMYENESASGTEKTCSSINLKLFQHCAKAPDKDCKKSVHTLVLEPVKEKSGKPDKSKNISQVTRRLFYPETVDEKERWMSKLNDAISLSSAGSNSTLTHITKTRAGPPRGNRGRRPPSKAHLKERALMTEVALEEVSSKEEGSKKSKQGSFPSAAMKPRPLASKKSQIPDAVSEANGVGINGEAGPPKTPSPALKPSTNLSPKKSDESDTGATSGDKKPPKLPPASLKPSVKVSEKLSDEDEPDQDDNPGQNHSDEDQPDRDDNPDKNDSDEDEPDKNDNPDQNDSDEVDLETSAEEKTAPISPPASPESSENLPEKSSLESGGHENGEHGHDDDEDDASSELPPTSHKSSEDNPKECPEADDPERDTSAVEKKEVSKTADVEPSTPAVENSVFAHDNKEGISTETCIENDESPPTQPENDLSVNTDGKQSALTDTLEDANDTQERPKESGNNTEGTIQSEEMAQTS